MKRVYCLYRVSTLGQVTKDGRDELPIQKQACHDFAAQQGWLIEKEFQELGVSGFKVSAKDRDVLQDIQQAAIEGKFDILLVYMFDRLGRKEDETPFVVEWFTQQGIEVWSAQEGQRRFDSHVDKLMNYIRFWQASGESVKTSVRTKAGMAQMVRDGYFAGGIAPTGYRLVDNRRTNKRGERVMDIEIDPEEANIAKLIFERYVHEGYGGHRIVQYLAQRGIKNCHGRMFSDSSIRSMIKNPLYIGILRHGETRSEHLPHLQIIDNETFDRAQHIRTQRSNQAMAQRTLPLQTKGATLLSGNIFCGSCGGRLTITTNNRKRIRYTCYTAHILDDIVTMLLLDLFKNVKDTPAEALIQERHKAELSIAAAALKGAKADLKKLTDNLKTYQAEVINAIQGTSSFDADILNDLIIQTKTDITKAQQEASRHEQELTNKQQHLDSIKEQYRNIITWADMFADSEREAQKMIAAYLIESVKVSRGYELDIKFNVVYEHFCSTNQPKTA